MPPITPCLWFNSNAEEAVNFYLTVFKNAKITHITHYAKATEKVSGKPAGTVMTIGFEANGQNFLALNGGNEFSFTPAISLIINCDTQDEIDTYWEKLTAGGQVIECGWLTDKFGITWQVTPKILDELLTNTDDAKKERVLAALLNMKKLDIETLKNA
jgi:predicted 3-demethylubiquinone-9 3-methyltransferase (glyoxalase superfamily)